MEALRKAIIDAGGFEAVSESTHVAASHLYNVCNETKPLTARTMRKIRPVVILPDAVWMGMLTGDSAETADVA